MKSLGSHRRLACLLLCSALASGCNEGPTDPKPPGDDPPPPPTIVWNQIRGGLGVGDIRAIWGDSPQRLFAVHAAGILRYDGYAWTAESIPPSLPALNTVWGASEGAVFAAGDDGVILLRTGSGWTEMSSPTGLDIQDLHGNSAADVYAVASTPDAPDAAELLHYDGTAWTHVDTRDGADGNAVCATPGLVFVVCDGGIAFRHDGTTLSNDANILTDDLHDVWAASASDAYAVGDAGRILHWNGTAWSLVAIAPAHLRSVSGSASDDVVAVGDAGVIYHFNGGAWLLAPSGTQASLAAACIFAGGPGVAAGEFGTVVIGGGALWAPRNIGQPFVLESVWSAGSYYMAVGTGPAGGVIRDRAGSAWTVAEGLHAISGFGLADLVAGGDGGAMYRYDGANWSAETSNTSSTLRSMTSLVSRFGNPFRIYAVGDDGTIVVWRAGTWVPAAPPAGAEDYQFVDVWAAATDDVFAVARNATSILRYDDPYEVADWTLEATPATTPLLAVSGWRGDVYIVSEAGEIYFNDGAGWAPMASPVTTPLRDIRSIRETSVFAVGDGGVIVYSNGTTWWRTQSPFAGDLLSVWGGENESVFAVGADGAVLEHQD